MVLNCSIIWQLLIKLNWKCFYKIFEAVLNPLFSKVKKGVLSPKSFMSDQVMASTDNSLSVFSRSAHAKAPPKSKGAGHPVNLLIVF
jgi:hypothetical protein